MRAYRIVKKGRAAEAFSGEGARRYGGRWNLPGVPMVYCAESRALAALECLGHFQGAERRIPFVLFTLEIPDDRVEVFDGDKLPAGWRGDVPIAATQELGTAWIRRQSAVALRVPSVHVPEEGCILLNPEHPDTRRVQIYFPVDYGFDDRL
jgi:RES domain-containing protein